MTSPVVIYGASGYTGKLIAWHLAEAGIPFIAAGRDLARLEEQMALVPELEGAEYECRAVEHDTASLIELFTGARIVYNVVGPFSALGRPVAEAALAAGCHYLDTTGETDWMRAVRDEFAAQYAARKLLLAPACSYMWAAGNLAAEIALETSGVDSLDILYLADSATSVASTKSFLRMCTQQQYYLENRALAPWPMATSYPVTSPDAHRMYRALPWSGGGEPVWYQEDERVRNCATMVAFKNPVMFDAVIKTLEDFEKNYSHLPDAEQARICDELGGQMTQTEPDRENPDVNRSVISCIGRGNVSGVKVVLRGNSPYIQTGLLGAEACRRILSGQLLATGFQSPAKAFGARQILNVWAEHGYHTWNVETN